MRWNLLKNFDDIYIIDLHGNAKKKEICKDGTIDKNVFDIQQGVCICIFVKSNFKNNNIANVWHTEIQGIREIKTDFLNNLNIYSEKLKKLSISEPYYFFKNFDNDLKHEYENGFKINELFIVNGAGIITSRDHFIIDTNKNNLQKKLKDFADSNISDSEIRNKYQLNDNSMWSLEKARQNFKTHKITEELFVPIAYRPFDKRITYFQTDVILNLRNQTMQNFINVSNIGLCLSKQFKSGNQYHHVFVTNTIIESSYISNKTSEITSIFPLFLKNNEKIISENIKTKQVSNFNLEIIKQISEKLEISFVSEKINNLSIKQNNYFTPIDLLDYIYAILHSQKYRQKYNEFLKIDFPSVPFPKDLTVFEKLVYQGSELRKIHLFEHSVLEHFTTKYPKDGNNLITKIFFSQNKVWINDTQYFDNVPEVAWNFYIGGYQPAQKWLKDRKTQKLEFDEILHYQKIIVALTETDKLMKEINNIEIVLP